VILNDWSDQTTISLDPGPVEKSGPKLNSGDSIKCLRSLSQFDDPKLDVAAERVT
jgi:hypothetical protein